MGELRNRVILQTRQWLDPNLEILPDWDYNYTYPITVFDAVKRTTDDNSSTLSDEIDAIYRLISGKQDIIDPGVSGNLMTWTGVRGQIGSTEVTKAISTDKASRSHHKIPTERAVAEALDNKTPLSSFNAHASDKSIHISDIERAKWNSMAPLSKLESHISNTSLHITDAERGRWNNKADADALENHIYNMNNPHNVTAHQTGTYTREEIDDMFENLRESFFNYKNIIWDSRTKQAELVDYDAANWNPNYVLSFKDTLPDVPNVDLTYFALQPATDYELDESQDIKIWVKLPGMAWQEVGYQTMEVGDMVIQYPDTIMYTWVQGRFIRVFTGDTNDDIVTGGKESDMLWRPYIDENGDLAWIKSKEVIPPAPMTIKGEDGYTPIKGVDYFDGKDGVGVPIGGTSGELLVKVTDENFDTNWKSLMDLLLDLSLAGEVLPEGLVDWDNIKGKPEWYQELGDHDDGFVSQKVITKQFDIVTNKINDVLDLISILNQTKSDFEDHINDFNNPHRVTAAGIGAVPMSTFTDHLQNFNNPHNVSAKQVGLGNVNNTSDLDKPISNATQEALDKIWDRIKVISDKLDKIVYVKNIIFDANKCALHVTFSNGTEDDIKIPIPEIFDSMYYDPSTKELVVILPNGEHKRINITELITTYFGSISPNIQVVIEDNYIKATIIPGSVGELEIAYSVHLRGSPTTTTQPISDNSTRIATTEFVRNQVIDNLISYETDRPLSANMGRILNQRKADIEDVLQIINDMAVFDVIDNLDSTNPMAALSANMGRHLDLTKAPRVHTSTEGATFGRATISVFGHTKASDTDPQMDGTVFRGTDDGEYARGDHRHPTDLSRAPIHWPDVAHNQFAFTGEPRSTLPPDDSNDDRIATTEWIRRNAVGIAMGECTDDSSATTKHITLRSTFMSDPVFIQQIGSTIAVTFSNDDLAIGQVLLEVQNNSAAPVIFGGLAIINGMIKANHTYLFVYDGSNWRLVNPSGIHPLPDDDNSNSFVSSEWVRRNAVGISFGKCTTETGNTIKVVSLESSFMDYPVLVLQKGTTVSVKFSYDAIVANSDTADRKTKQTIYMNVQNTGAKPIKHGGSNIISEMIKGGNTYVFTYDGTDWNLLNPSAVDTLPDDDNSNSLVSSEWVRRNAKSTGTYQGYSTSAGSSQVKNVVLQSSTSVDVDFERVIGTVVCVYFTNQDISNNPTQLKVGNTDARQIMYGGEKLQKGDIGTKHMHAFVFDGTYWWILNPIRAGSPGGNVTVGPGIDPDPDIEVAPDLSSSRKIMATIKPTYEIGDMVVYNIIITNTGTGDAYNVRFKEEPLNLNIISASRADTGGALSKNTSGEYLVGTIPVGESIIVKVTTTIAENSSFSNTARINADNIPKEIVVTSSGGSVDGKPDLSSSTKILSTIQSTYKVGNKVNYKISLVNTGTETAQNVMISENPENLTINSIKKSTGEDLTYTSGMYYVGDIGVGDVVVLTLNCTINSVGEFKNGLVATGDDMDPVDIPGNGGIAVSPAVINQLAGYSGFTVENNSSVDANGQVNKVWFAINFTPTRSENVKVTLSDAEGAFACKMGDNSTVILSNPEVVDTTNSSVIVQFTMKEDNTYPSNSPCQLVYRLDNAWLDIDIS